jgi:hypothetical protein
MSKTSKPPKPSGAYETIITIRAETDTLKLRDLPGGLPVVVRIGETIKLVGKVSHHRAGNAETAVIAFDLAGDDQTAPLSSKEIRAWFADALGALLAHEDTPNEVCDALTEAVTEIGNRSGAYNLDSDLARHILRRSFMVADAERRADAEQGDDGQ